MTYFKIGAVKSITFATQLSHRHDLSVLSYFLILTMSIKSIITWERVEIYQEIQDGRRDIVKMSHHFTNNLTTRSILYLCENLHERYYLFPRRPTSQNQVINA